MLKRPRPTIWLGGRWATLSVMLLTTIQRPSVIARKLSIAGLQHRRRFARSDRSTLIWPMVRASETNGTYFPPIIRLPRAWYSYMEATGNRAIANIFPVLLREYSPEAGQPHCPATH